MNKRNQKYIVTLSIQEKEKLQKVINSGKLSSRSMKRAQILLAVDSNASTHFKQRELASVIGTSVPTIINTIKEYLEQGVDFAISHTYNPSSAPKKKVDGRMEAIVLQLACGSAPEGYSRWSLELLTRQVNKQLDGQTVSKETIRILLKKMNLSLI
jgi:transposase